MTEKDSIAITEEQKKIIMELENILNRISDENVIFCMVEALSRQLARVKNMQALRSLTTSACALLELRTQLHVTRRLEEQIEKGQV